ncbi:MAG: AI-2E family transporter [Oscillospiraceae bacterium]
MKFRWDKKYLYTGVTAFVVIVSCIVFLIVLLKWHDFVGTLNMLGAILMPFIIGLAIAYILSPVLNFFDEKCFIPLLKKTKLKKVKRVSRLFSVTCSIFLLIAVIVSLFYMVIPQLIESINGIINEFPNYVTNLKEWMSVILSKNPQIASLIDEQFENISLFVGEWVANNLAPQVNTIISGVTTGVIGIIVAFKNFLIGIIIAIYIMLSKEKFFAQAKRTLYSLFKIETSNSIIRNTRNAHRIFGGFITGKLIDSFIIGIICFIGMTLLRLPYPLLISIIIGITNVVPFFGPFIGAIPSGLLILMIDPLQCLYFALFILVLQQFDGNILGPKILGDSTGLPAFWVMFAILLGSGLFGFAGMVLGVPTFAVIYSLISSFFERRLKNKNLPTLTHEYDNIDVISPETLQPLELIAEEKPPRKKFVIRKNK